MTAVSDVRDGSRFRVHIVGDNFNISPRDDSRAALEEFGALARRIEISPVPGYDAVPQVRESPLPSEIRFTRK